MNVSLIEPCERSYNFHGLHLRISADPAVATAVYARFAAFARGERGDPALTFTFDCVREDEDGIPAPSLDAVRPVYDSAMGAVLYADALDQLIIQSADGVYAVCDPARGATRVVIPPSLVEQSWLLSHPLVTIPLIEMLKRCGRFSVHAAGLAIDGRGLLFPGTSGAGKSTLTLALVRAGLGFLGDDMLFLAHEADGPRVLAFPDEIDVTDSTVQLFPELADVLTAPKAPGWPKHQVRAPERFGVPIVWSCKPAVLVFPHVAGTARSRLEPMDRMEALLELAPNVLLTAPQAAQAHLDALAALVETCACYRLETGRDLESLPALIAGLVK
jgi:hypothetical protein